MSADAEPMADIASNRPSASDPRAGLARFKTPENLAFMTASPLSVPAPRRRGLRSASTENFSAEMWFFSPLPPGSRSTSSRRGINTSVTMGPGIAGSLQFERSAQSGNKKLLTPCAQGNPGERDERSRIRPIAGGRQNGDRTRAAGRSSGPAAIRPAAAERRQRQRVGLASHSVSRGLVRGLLMAPQKLLRALQ